MNKNVITVEKKDITRIGNTAFNQNGNLAIVCNGETSNIEEILLRNILKCFGDDYKVVSSEDNIWVNVKGEEVYDILFTTNLPYELFEEVWHSEDSVSNTPKKSNKIVKSILTIIMLVFIGLAANAQEVHGYINDIATELSSEGFLVKKIGYILDTDTIEADIKTPTHYDEELTRLAILRTMKNYEDIRLIQPWKKWGSKYDGSTATYQLPNGKRLVIFIGYLSSYDYCLVCMYEGDGLTDD